jgi:ribonuclease HII
MKYPNFYFEGKLWKKGDKAVAGVDEVGRGCFAGPVVAGCVIFPESIKIPDGIYINDSKKVTALRREKAEVWIRQNAVGWGIGESSSALINRIGMARATKKAFRKAISEARHRLGRPIDYLLIDAFFIPFVPGLPTRRRKDSKGRFRKNPKGRQMAIVDGDEKSLTIGAASIVAKVYRDRLMNKLGAKYPLYGWRTNKGYGTKKHQRAILKYGINRFHRKVFVKTFLAKRKKV